MRQIIIVIAMVASVPTVGAAQSASDARQELDRLIPEWRAARSAVVDAERALQHAPGTMVVERGHLRLIADSTIASAVAQAAATVSQSLDDVFGQEAALLSGYRFTAHLQPSRGGIAAPTIVLRRLEHATQPSARGAGERLGSEQRPVPLGTERETRDGLAAAMELLAATPLHATLDEELRIWFRYPLAVAPESPHELEDVYGGLTTASTDISRGCLAGDIRRCRQALGLAPVADPILEGHTATERRVLVEAKLDELRTPAKAAEYDRCVIDGDDEACIGRLRELPPEQLTTTYSSPATHRSFARWAITQGGADAYSRLRNSPSRRLDERLAAAAGVPADSLVASWHAHVMTARPVTPATPPLTAIATLLWIGVCGALALRSSRWR
jgi:hypothetical protein